MKAVVAAFNQEKALVGAFSVITNLRMELFEALVPAQCAGVRDARQPRVRRPHPRQHDLHLHLQRHLRPLLPLAGNILLRWLGLPSPG